MRFKNKERVMYKFKTEPYEHQKDALKKCWNKKSFAIFAEMGTGKTKIALDNACILYNKGRIDRVLIVAPKGTYMNWVDQEIPVHVPDYIEKNVVAWKQSTSSQYKQQLLDIKKSEDFRFKIMVMNVEALSTKKGVEFAKIFLIGKSMMIVDESTTIKNPQAKRTKNILALSKEAKYRRILTGSPVTQSPMDLWSQMDFLDPEILGQQSFYAFRTRYAVVITANAAGGTHKYQKIVKFKNLAQLGNLVSPHSYRILKKDCLDLPEKTFVKREVELTDEQRVAYQDMKTNAMTVLKGQSLTAVNVLTQLMRLHQITCGHMKTDSGDVLNLKNNRVAELMQILSATTGKTTLPSGIIADSPLVLEAAVNLRAAYADSPGDCKNIGFISGSFFCNNFISLLLNFKVPRSSGLSLKYLSYILFCIIFFSFELSSFKKSFIKAAPSTVKSTSTSLPLASFIFLTSPVIEDFTIACNNS